MASAVDIATSVLRAVKNLIGRVVDVTISSVLGEGKWIGIILTRVAPTTAKEGRFVNSSCQRAVSVDWLEHAKKEMSHILVAIAYAVCPVLWLLEQNLLQNGTSSAAGAR